jgi:PAS domain S-box-containing protein
MGIQDKSKEELISELKELQQENNSLKSLHNDISRLKKTQMDLIASEIRYRSLFESAKDGILILDAETGKIVDVNPFLIDLLGYSHDQFFEKSIWEIGTFKDIIANQNKYLDLKKNEYVRYNDLPLETKDGRIIHVEFVSNVHIADNQNVIQCNIRDITERIKIEKELIKAKEKAEESDRLKSAFLANMSHEIRTPMNGILGFADLLKEPNLKSDKQQKYIGIIEKSGTRMLNIINSIVDISIIEAGLMKLDMKETNVNKQIEFIYTFFKSEAETKGIKLSFSNTLPQKEATIKTDSEKLYAILTNLVKNAIKYTPEGSIELGYVSTASTTTTPDKMVSEPVELRFYVKDTGIGIPAERQEAIFDRFIQVDIEDKMARQGAGLGLSISKAYVEMLGGEIWVESEKGKGSTFYFTLPYNFEPKKKTIVLQPASSDKNDTIRKLKILVAEDDEVSEMLIDSYIKMFGKEILKARTGAEAVEACRDNPDIDLILMDIQMPGMGGYEATKQIREFNKEVIIIAQTAYGLTGDRERAIKTGCNDYITKPIKKSELLALIQKHFGK